MKKRIIVESEDNAEVKDVKKNVYKTNCNRLINNNIIEWLIYMLGYAFVLFVVSRIMPSFELNTAHFGIYALFAAIIIYILDQTIKPIIRYITLPITILSMGILYPITNVIILYITGFLLGQNLNIKSFLGAFIAAILISFLNMLMEGFVIKPIVNRK